MTFRVPSYPGLYVLRVLFISSISLIIIIHLFQPIKSLKNGLSLNGPDLFANAILPSRSLVNLKPAMIHEMTGGSRQTKFILPVIEQYEYPRESEKIITYDFMNHPPLFLILNKNTYKQLDPNNFFTQCIIKSLEKYQLVFENEEIRAYKRI